MACCEWTSGFQAIVIERKICSLLLPKAVFSEAEFVARLEELAKEDEETENDDRADMLLLHF